MSKRKWYKTKISFYVFSETPIPDDMGVTGIAAECNHGEWVGSSLEMEETILTGKEMADALTAVGSDPGFFMLDAEGNVTL